MQRSNSLPQEASTLSGNNPFATPVPVRAFVTDSSGDLRPADGPPPHGVLSAPPPGIMQPHPSPTFGPAAGGQPQGFCSFGPLTAPPVASSEDAEAFRAPPPQAAPSQEPAYFGISTPPPVPQTAVPESVHNFGPGGPGWAAFQYAHPPPLQQFSTRRSDLAKKALDSVKSFSAEKDIELFHESIIECVEEVRSLDGPSSFGPVDLASLIRQKLSEDVLNVLKADPEYSVSKANPDWLVDCLQHFYLGPFPKRLRARWSEIKSFAPLAKESALVFVARGRKILGRYRRLVPMTPEAFSMMEYSVLFETLPIGSAARRYVVTNLQDHSPSGLRDCLRQYKETAMSQSPGASIWLATIPFSSGGQPQVPSAPQGHRPSGASGSGSFFCPLCKHTHKKGMHSKCAGCGANKRCATQGRPCPGVSHECTQCKQTGHLDSTCIQELKKKVDVKLATVSFTAAAVETTEDSLEDPHFGKDDGATVDAVGKNYLKRLPSSVRYTVSPLPAPVPVQTAGEDGVVMQATHSADVPDIMFGEKRADLSFLILPDSPVPFLFSKALAQRLGAVMDYRSDLMTIPSAFGDPTELLWIDLGRYYAMTLRQAPVFEASPAISVTLSPAGPPAAFMATVSAPVEAPLQEIYVSDDDDDDCPSLCGSSDTAFDCADGESACPNQGEHDTVSLPSSFPAIFIKTRERFVFLLSNLQSLVMEVHCDCAHVGVEDVLSQLHRVFSFEVSVRSLREVVRKVLASCIPCSRVKGPVGFSIPCSSFNRGAYPGARLHMNSQYFGLSESGHTHQLSILEDYHDFGLGLRYNGPPTSAEAAAFLRDVWIPRFGAPLEIRCNPGSEFIREPFTSLCTELNIILSFSPSGYKDGNSLAERWQREVLVSVRTILLERGLPPTMWPTVYDEAIRHLNNRLSRWDPSKPRQTAVSGAAPLPCFRRFLSSQRRPSPAALRKYAVGDEVMYNTGASLGGGRSGPEHKCGPVWYPYHVEAKENDHYYKIVAIENDTRPQKTSASPHQLRPSAVPLSPELTVVSSSADPSSSASEPPLPSAPSGPLAPGTMVVASSPEHSLLWVGEVHGAVPSGDDSRDFLYEVHAWGTHQKYVLEKRAWYPSHYVAGGSYVTYDSRGRRTDPEIVELRHSNVVASGFEMVKNRRARGSRLPSDLCARLSNGSRGCFFSQYPMSEPTDPTVHAAVNFLTSSDCSTSVFAATTHKPVRLSSLNFSEREGVREADAKEDKGWQDRQVYERVPLTVVPPDVQRVPLQQVRTEKLRDDGTRIFKTRTVIRGDLVNRIGLDVTTHLCPPDAMRLVLQLALDLCKQRGVSLSLKKVDVI
uniref:Uncharacterized protein n=1 Tax=Chromera velia CCMP2878 TaxID=1169474 RepID=A0A0G4IFQ4_9ALVE|eukprot:Cvel_13970.t1-p1 / transcript=Cvel_13970.t1 / gene=Cvel_13970 / organism=Chromera_velia_CCMP2878 / gene_product=hypothetical protein / transcript_product=hypothetical protein / location=Cvel_scaffold976:29002-32988(+) / protein_length=1329 / sequence_SO=supercontig / SO=protein_coding / is_pseudo=false